MRKQVYLKQIGLADQHNLDSMKLFAPLLLLLMIGSACAKKNAKEQAVEDDKIIQEYLTTNGLSATKTDSGLYYYIESQGGGASCNSNSDVRVYYKGYFTNGEVFDESSAAGISFNLQQVIKGWIEGIPYFKAGGIGKLFIPSALAYGTKGNSAIPPNSVLIFDVKLIEVL